jgi:hypothetical protein
MYLFIILILILILLLFLYKSNKTSEPFTTKKGLFVYYGGGFRDGPTRSSIQDTEKGYNNQYYASQSHIKLNKVLKNKGYDMDTLVCSYHSKYESNFKIWYDPFDVILNTIKMSGKSTDGRDTLIKSCINSMQDLKMDEYDFVLFIRIDLFLKRDFFDVLDLKSQKVQFLAHNFFTGHCGFTEKKDPEVVDMILYVPKNHFDILDKNFKLNHKAWTYYKKQYQLTDNDLGFMTDKRFDSNSYLDLNPFYVISGRPENQKNHTDEKTNPEDYGTKGNKRGVDCPLYKKISESYLEQPAKKYYEESSFYLTN